ncbi:nose resistant to fluoxetine protein 6 [Anastrepha obliqua]|uniref:nose resistant to fluoxetine protein 6 n=1 Tax=Anastrepha obliqua TaxID=95512 RepID=UPI002409064E|nr:nose resistant to fluoxetine protein 6 [Anastrepha obliqua]XP_054728014.1 nose resistant to fluoxetine protein 6 [Anastrepha obliqua]XP_054728015.1 nose resistant to fluoxetine protein 6 [Anastrepha obliqua]
MRPKITSYFVGAHLLLLTLITRSDSSAHALNTAETANPTCSLKDNCNLNDNFPTGAGESSDKTASKLENKIASIFEDKVNYSLKLFADADVIEYNTLESNLTGRTHIPMPATANLTLSHLQDAADVEEDERVYLYNIGRRFISIATPFDAARNPKASPKCRSQMRRFLEGLNNFDFWALKMHDSTGKITSGILNGNINQPGDFDQCLGISTASDGAAVADSDANEIKGQYCLAYAQPVLPHKSKRLRALFTLLQSHGPFRSEFNDPGHRVPRYSLINWGICVPNACTYQDVEYTVNEYLSNMTSSTGISFQVRVEPKMCQVRDNKPWDRNTTWAVRFFLVILSIAVLSTIYERCLKGDEKPNEWFTAFSLDKNLRWLFSTHSSPNDIEAVHGIRFLNAAMLLFSHKSMAMFFNPYNNRTEMSESLGRSWTVIGRAASLYTDPFLLFSGMLTAYSLFGRLFKGQPIRLRNEYISRLMRIVPPLAALILFCTFVLPLWGSGPQWNLVVGHHADICKRNWWRNLLFIHNYFGFSEMCLTHTHHLGIDTELFAVAPIMILGLWKWPRKGLFALLLLGAIGTAARYYTTVVNQLSNYIYFGTNIQRLFRTADYMYSFPPHRSTVYIMGILLGYCLRKYRGIQLSTAQLRIGWVIATASVLVSLLGPAPMGHISYQYNKTHAAIYAAFAPIAWCIFFAWIVFVSHNGYKNKFTDMLSWKGFQVSTKLSYAIYLTQFPVFFFNVGRRRHIHHYYNFVSIILDTNEFICIFLASVALTIFFDAPFQNIKKLIFNRASASTKNQDLGAVKASTGILCDSKPPRQTETLTSSATNTTPPKSLLTNCATSNGKIVHAHID